MDKTLVRCTHPKTGTQTFFGPFDDMGAAHEWAMSVEEIKSQHVRYLPLQEPYRVGPSNEPILEAANPQ